MYVQVRVRVHTCTVERRSRELAGGSRTGRPGRARERLQIRENYPQNIRAIRHCNPAADQSIDTSSLACHYTHIMFMVEY